MKLDLDELNSLVDMLIGDDESAVKFAFNVIEELSINPFSNPILYTLGENIDYGELLYLIHRLRMSKKWYEDYKPYRKNELYIKLSNLTEKGLVRRLKI